MTRQEESTVNEFCFTDFDNRFHARLAVVIPRFLEELRRLDFLVVAKHRF